MTHGRQEPTPSQQLAELRKARERYATLAKQNQGQDDPPDISDEVRERQQDAQRIVLAYDKSIANMTANLDRVQQAELLTSAYNRSRFKFAAVAVAILLIAVAGYFIFAGSGLQMIQSAFAPPADRPVTRAPPVAAAQADKTGPGASHATLLIPVPTARPDIGDSKAADIQRPPTQAPVTERPKRVITTVRTNSPGNGFVAKVLQPDGTFKEEHFSSDPPQ